MADTKYLQHGTIVQGYEVIKPLGKGKFSTVYAAKRCKDGLMCALKKINVSIVSVAETTFYTRMQTTYVFYIACMQVYDSMEKAQQEKCMSEIRLLQVRLCIRVHIVRVRHCIRTHGIIQVTAQLHACSL